MIDINLQIPGTETRTKYDLGIRKKNQLFGEIALTGFYVKQDNAAVLTSQIVIVNGEDYALYENADLDNYGVELDIQSHRLENGLQFFFNVTAMKTRRKENGSWIRDKEVFFRIDNLTDKEYSTVNGYPDEGRRYMVGFSAVF